MEHIELAPLRFTPYLKSVIWEQTMFFKRDDTDNG